MAKAIDTGLPKMRIEEAAARRQARIDSGREAIVGINKYRLDKEDPLDILDVDNTAVREAQIRRLEQLRANRDEDKVQSCLEAITNATESGEGNLLALALEAARARASLGEISFAVEKVCGRHKAVIRSISGVYSSEYEDDDVIKEVRQMADDFEELEGRRPRIMIAKMGQDGHDVVPKLSLHPSQIWALTWISDLCSKLQKKQHKMRWIMTFTSSASVLLRQVTKHCYLNL